MSSFGPVNLTSPKYGECVYCWDENHARRHQYHFEPRQQLIGPTCRHRLEPARRKISFGEFNRIQDEMREEYFGLENRKRKGDPVYQYWRRRAYWPDYCGEPGELSINGPPKSLELYLSGG